MSVCLLSAFLLGAGGDGAAKVKDELKKLEGTWSVSELTYNGKDHKNLKFNFVFKGDEAIVEGDDKVKVEYARIKVKLDPAVTPKIMDIIVAGGIQKDASMEGIYELKNQELKICIKVFGKDRPDTFAAPDGSSIALIVLKKSTP